MLFRNAKKRKKYRSLTGRNISRAKKTKTLARHTRKRTAVKKKIAKPKRKSVRKQRTTRTRRKHKHDLTLSGVGANPFIQSKPIERLFRLFFRLTIFGVFFFLSHLFLTHPAIQISNINIAGTRTIPTDDVLQTVENILSGKRLGLFSAKHYAMVPLQDISVILKEKYPIDTIKVSKTFPASLTITIEEQVSSIIYDDTKQYFLIDKNGVMVEPLRTVASYEWAQSTPNLPNISTSSTEFLASKVHIPDVLSFQTEFDGLPILVDNRTSAFTDSVHNGIINIDLVSSTLAWQRTLKDNGIAMSYMVIADPRALQAVIYDKQGRVFQVSLERNISAQLAKINTVVEEHPTATKIDVRFPNRVYWE